MKVAPGRSQNRRCGGPQADHRRRRSPGRGGSGAGSQSGRSEHRQADQCGGREAHGAANDANHSGLGCGHPHQLAPCRAASAQQSLISAALTGTRGDHRGGQQARENGGGQTQKQEQHPRVGGITASRAERGLKIVADLRAARATSFKVVRRGVDRGVRRLRIGGQRVVESAMNLCADQIRARAGHRVEHPMPLGFAEDQDVIGRCYRLGTDGCANFLEQRVGLGQVDHAIDFHLDGRHAGPADAHRVAGHHMKVGGGLLGDQDTAIGANQGAKDTGKLLAVVRGDTQYHCRTRCLGASRGLCHESGRVCEANRQSRVHTGRGPHRVKDGCRLDSGLHLHLPVDGHSAQSTSGHRPLRSGEEAAQAGHQGDRGGDTGCGRGQSAPPASKQTLCPCEDHAVTRSVVVVVS